ncbi:YraN family protein [Candidatus Daviesbacteria bacterium]|nr:YraN family protein [Candidatus Daviesbacteria bacterium]
MVFKYANKRTGKKGEELACNYLKKSGYKILSRNFLIRGGEIDIIARDGDILVFVEVKARYSHEYGLPKESITPWKIKALKKSALFYIQKINWGNNPYRFDLVGIDYAFSKDSPDIELIKNITF